MGLDGSVREFGKGECPFPASQADSMFKQNQTEDFLDLQFYYSTSLGFFIDQIPPARSHP